MKACLVVTFAILSTFICLSVEAQDASTVELLKQQQAVDAQRQKSEEYSRQKINNLEGELFAAQEESLKLIQRALTSKGIKFDDVRPSLDRANDIARSANAPEISIQSHNDDFTFAMVQTWLTEEPAVEPAGLHKLVFLSIGRDEIRVDSNGTVAKDCYVTVYAENMVRVYQGILQPSADLGRYTCTEVLNQTHIDRLAAAFAKALSFTLLHKSDF